MKNEYIVRKNGGNNHLYINMSEIIWATPIAMSTAIAESEWKRELDDAITVFKTWKKTYPQEAEMNWWFYSGRMGIRPRVAKHLWENRHNNQMNLIPYDQDKRILEAQTAKTKDQRPVIKMVTPVEQAVEMARSEIKREREMAKSKTFVPPGRRKTSTDRSQRISCNTKDPLDE